MAKSTGAPWFGLLALAAVAALPVWAADDLAAASTSAGRELADGLRKSDERPPIAVVAVQAFTEPASAPGQGANAADLVAASLAGSSKLKLLDRAKTAALAAEARVKAAAGGGNEAELGRRAGAQALLVGALLDSADGFILQARLISVATGKVLASARRSAKVAQASALPAAQAGKVESQSIEVAMRKLSDSLAEGFARLPGNARYRRLAVVPFSEVGEQAQKRHIGTIVAAEVATDLKRDHNLLLVERQKLTEVMGELRLQQSGAVDPASAAQLGQIADAQALVIGSASDLGDHYLVNARVVATETGETLSAGSASVSAAGMISLASDAVVLRSKKDAVFRSLLIPGWGQIYNRQPVKGFAIMGCEVALFGAALAFHFAGQKAYDDYQGKTSAGDLGSSPTAEAQRLYDLSVTRYGYRNIALYTAAGLWLVNLIDAYVSGVDGDTLLGGSVARSGGPLARPPRVFALAAGPGSVGAAWRW